MTNEMGDAQISTLEKVRALDARHEEQFGDDPGMMVRHALLANRKEGWIRLWGESTGINSRDPVEFMLISHKSGHDYEAYAYAFADPLEIHRALEFIGARPGRPVNYEKLQMWPKGDRVNVFFEWNTGTPRRVRAEEVIYNKNTGKTMPEKGFCFVGSVWVEDEAGTGRVYAASEYDPRCIVADYNEPLTVLDVPYKQVDTEVYGSQILNAEVSLPHRYPMEFVIERLLPLGEHHVEDLFLKARAQAGARGDSLQEMVFDLGLPDGETLGENMRLTSLLAHFGRITGAGKDPFVTVAPDGDLTLAGVRGLYVFLSALDTGEGIRIEPPLPGQPYYRAFIPPEAFRERENRPSQPCEIYLRLDGGGVTGHINDIDEIWADDADEPELVVTKIDIGSVDQVSAWLATKERLPVVLFFLPAEMRYKQFLAYARPFTERNSTIYVFLPPVPEPSVPVGR
ncbi:MAG: hypothetical protein EOM20_18785 [Spartobacteria bacterium]|nr:hypothetical protein [Spartobacteria bacterium]